MITGPNGREILGGGGAVAVDVKSLGRELRRLWQESSESGGAQITRACTRNLIVVVDDDKSAALATEVIAAVAHRHPTRAFVVAAAGPKDDPALLEAHLLAHCILRGGGRHVCCEQISLTVGSAARRRAAGAIVPLLVPDLPVFVWRLGMVDWDDELLIHLLGVTDRLIVDTAFAADPAAALADLAERQRDDPWSPGDFEWSRLAPWREAVAALFDAPDTAWLPAGLDRVVVRYGKGGKSTCAALLGAWACDRLDVAQTDAMTGLAARVKDGDATGDQGPATLLLEPVEDVPPGAIAGIELSSRGPGAVCTIRVGTPDSALTGSVDVPKSGALRSRHPCRALAPEELLADQLDTPGSDAVFERALARAATLLAGISPD